MQLSVISLDLSFVFIAASSFIYKAYQKIDHYYKQSLRLRSQKIGQNKIQQFEAISQTSHVSVTFFSPL